jgi:hypothetical protein
MSEGEKTPPPIRPPIVIATAATFTMVKTMASRRRSVPSIAAAVVS